MRYTLFGRTGPRVSELAWGTMTFGWGAVDLGASRPLLDAYADAGGNFVDTANTYSEGASETIVGELLVRSGKVLYVGVSDWPAWEIARANNPGGAAGLDRVRGLAAALHPAGAHAGA